MEPDLSSPVKVSLVSRSAEEKPAAVVAHDDFVLCCGFSSDGTCLVMPVYGFYWILKFFIVLCDR